MGPQVEPMFGEAGMYKSGFFRVTIKPAMGPCFSFAVITFTGIVEPKHINGQNGHQRWLPTLPNVYQMFTKMVTFWS